MTRRVIIGAVTALLISAPAISASAKDSAPNDPATTVLVASGKSGSGSGSSGSGSSGSGNSGSGSSGSGKSGGDRPDDSVDDPDDSVPVTPPSTPSSTPGSPVSPTAPITTTPNSPGTTKPGSPTTTQTGVSRKAEREIRCGSRTLKIEAKSEQGSIRVKAEIKPRQKSDWSGSLTHERMVVWKGRADRGRFERDIPDYSGSDKIGIRLTDGKGSVCSGDLVLPG